MTYHIEGLTGRPPVGDLTGYQDRFYGGAIAANFDSWETAYLAAMTGSPKVQAGTMTLGGVYVTERNEENALVRWQYIHYFPLTGKRPEPGVIMDCARRA